MSVFKYKKCGTLYLQLAQRLFCIGYIIVATPLNDLFTYALTIHAYRQKITHIYKNISRLEQMHVSDAH